MRVLLEIRLLLAAQFLNWAFDAIPKRGCGDTVPIWLGIQKTAEALAKVRVERGAKAMKENHDAR